MLSIAGHLLSLLAFAAALLALRRRRGGNFGLWLPLAILYGWRIVSCTCIDLGGPLYSAELEEWVGPGDCAIPLALAYALVFAVGAVLARPTPTTTWRRADDGSVAATATAIAAAFLAALFGEMLVSGVVPVLAGIERYQYEALAGPFYGWAIKYGTVFSLALGRIDVRSRRPGGFAVGDALFAGFLVFLFLCGHRFSSFLMYAIFFAVGRRGRSTPPFSPQRRDLRQMLVPLAAFGCLVAAAVSISYFGTRFASRADEGRERLQARILIEQGQLWWATYDRVIVGADWDPTKAINDIANPYVPGRNSSMQFLMERTLGDRATDILDEGLELTGGYPEIGFELLGPVAAWPAIAVFAALLAACIGAVERVIALRLTPLSAIAVVAGSFTYLAALLLHISGMLNSLLVASFYAKLGTFLVSLVVLRAAGSAAATRIGRLGASALGLAAQRAQRPP